MTATSIPNAIPCFRSLTYGHERAATVGALVRAIVGDALDVAFVDEGLRLTVRHSKTDQEGVGALLAAPYGTTIRPVARVKAWLKVRGTAPGPLFTRFDAQGVQTMLPMSDRSTARLVQRAAVHAGLDGTLFGAHSLRAGS